MFIDAVVKRIENGYAVLVSDDCCLEVSIPVKEGETMYMKGENVSLIIDNDGTVKCLTDKQTKKRNPTNKG
ncbi:hypothetical protein [Acetivibrio straminisolvens]|uniref:DUF3006 domain-containing protein n=1 Tax=Acetivibrio straminisolvens JCM 21531 TaxID=1294263 RepID=W4V7C6_9FIRM|nr:hypothetical protein [Acetivibrio straminisolvens]GAE89086.1 hypothetical protein JCM21531_2580 [Acetivibrio straminisolvens JCM 21531]